MKLPSQYANSGHDKTTSVYVVNYIGLYFSASISNFLAVMEPMSAQPMELMLDSTYFVAVKFLDIIIIENSSIYSQE